MAAQTVLSLLAERVASTPDDTAFRWKEGGAWKTQTWRAIGDVTTRLAAGLIASGLEPRACAVVLSDTRPEWAWCDLAIQKAGGITVPIYPSNTPEQCAYIIADCGATHAFVDSPHQLEKLVAIRSQVPTLGRVAWMDSVAALDKPDAKGRTRVTLEEVVSEAPQEGLGSLDDLLSAGDALADRDAAVAARSEGVDKDAVCTVVYTSGTTGDPKGVVLTHDNFVFETEAVSRALDIDEKNEQLLFLPLAHIFARLLLYTSIRQGFITAFAQGIPQLMRNIAEVQPTFLGSVPRIYEKVYTRVVSGAEQAGGTKRRIFDWSIGVGMQMSTLRQQGREPGALLALKYRLATALVFRKIHELFGGRLKFLVSGGAPLSANIARFFHAAGILVLEGYGLTETTAATHCNRQDSYRFGTVGPPLHGVEVRIADDSEILVKGRNLLREYLHKPEETAAVLVDGWFHTGDIGEIDDDGKLRITDRKKDLIVTAGGKNVAPQPIENRLQLSPYVSQVMVHGDRRKFLSALITLDEAAVRAFSSEHDIPFTDLADLSQHPAIRKLIEGEVEAVNRDLASYETLKKFAVLEQELSQDAGELTPTLKVRRRAVTARYQSLLDSFYEGAP